VPETAESGTANHFSHTWLERNGWSSPQTLRRYGASARAARARRNYDRIMEDLP
jgi:integrase/recombinase XerD